MVNDHFIIDSRVYAEMDETEWRHYRSVFEHWGFESRCKEGNVRLQWKQRQNVQRIERERFPFTARNIIWADGVILEWLGNDGRWNRLFWSLCCFGELRNIQGLSGKRFGEYIMGQNLCESSDWRCCTYTKRLYSRVSRIYCTFFVWTCRCGNKCFGIGEWTQSE